MEMDKPFTLKVDILLHKLTQQKILALETFTQVEIVVFHLLGYKLKLSYQVMVVEYRVQSLVEQTSMQVNQFS